MNLLNSEWLIRMIDGSAKKPTDKLLAVYFLLDAWFNAPGIREKLLADDLGMKSVMQTCPALSAHLVKLAAQAGLRNPPVVVTQMLILLQGAIAEELRSPGMGALITAQQAAKFVVDQARPALIARVEYALRVGGYVASLAAMSMLAVYFWPSASSNTAQYVQQDAGMPGGGMIAEIDADLLIKALALKRSMAAGICPAPNFSSIPREQLPVYMGVVQSRLSGNPELDTQRLRTFLVWYEQNRAWECFSKADNKQRTILGMGV